MKPGAIDQGEQVWICVNECYYGPPGRMHHYRPGDRLLPGVPSGRHFRPKGSPGAAMVPARTAGDDPRSTVAMREALRGYGVQVDEGLPRKEIFAQLVKLEQEGKSDE